MHITDLSERATPGTRAVRSFEFTECEFRDDGPNGWVTFEGVASVVDTPYTVRDHLGEFTETIKAGAFDKTLAELSKRAAKGPQHDVALFVNHDTRALPLATVSAGNLTLSASPHLNVRAFMNPARPSVQEVRHAVSDGQARQMSIGFSVPNPKADQWNDDYTERNISEVKLYESSIVWRGASPTTSGAVRSLDELLALFPEGSEYDENEVRRALAHLEALLPAQVEAVADAIIQRDREDRERLERKIALRPGWA